MKKINKTIHYCWFGRGKKSELINNCISSWKKFCPDYEIIEWNEDNFDVNINNYVKEAYLEKKWAFISDYARLWIIYNCGGIYLDTDVELIRNLDNLLDYNEFFACETEEYVATGLGFGACKKSKIVKYLMNDYEDINFIKNDKEIDLTPCPVRNTKTIRNYLNYSKKFKNKLIINNTLILPYDYFCPFNYETGKLKITNNTIGIHWYGESWLTDNEKKLNKIKRKFLKYGIIGRVIYYIYKFIYLFINDKNILKNLIKKKFIKGDFDEKY